MVFGREEAEATIGAMVVVNAHLAHQHVGRRRPEIEIVHHIHVPVRVDEVAVHETVDRTRQLSDLVGTRKVSFEEHAVPGVIRGIPRAGVGVVHGNNARKLAPLELRPFPASGPVIATPRPRKLL